MQPTLGFKLQRAQLTSFSSNGCQQARQINWLTRWSAAFMTQINKYRRRHLLSSSCHHTRLHTRRKEVREATRHLAHQVARSTLAALSHPRLVEVSSCSIVVASRQAFMEIAGSGRTIVLLWPRLLKTVANRAWSLGTEVLGPTQHRISLRIKRNKKRYRSISTSRRQTLRLSNQWWLLRQEETTDKRRTGPQPMGRKFSIRDRKKAVFKTLALLLDLTRNLNNQIIVVKAWAKMLQGVPHRSALRMHKWRASSRRLYSLNNRSVKRRSQFEAQSLVEARNRIMGW